MKESGYYPPGTEFDPNSPWNESSNKDSKVDVEVCVSTTLSKQTTINVNNVIVRVEKNCETNDEGGIDRFDDIDYDYSNCNLIEDYKSNEFTILELLNILKQYIEEDLKHTKVSLSNTYDLKLVLKSLNSWVEDELEVILE